MEKNNPLATLHPDKMSSEECSDNSTSYVAIKGGDTIFMTVFHPEEDYEGETCCSIFRGDKHIFGYYGTTEECLTELKSNLNVAE